MNSEDYLTAMYGINDKTHNYIIKIKINRYSDIFNNLDSSPLNVRDLNNDVLSYIKDCSSDIPLKYGIDLYFCVLKEDQVTEKESQVRMGLKTYFSFDINSKKSSLSKSYNCVIKYTFASFILLFLGFFLEVKVVKSLFFNTLLEGLNIGGWIFLWQAITLLFFQHKDLKNEILQMKRLCRASIYFDYCRNI